MPTWYLVPVDDINTFKVSTIEDAILNRASVIQGVKEDEPKVAEEEEEDGTIAVQQ